ncbi:MAG: hypothetical protein LQ351_001522 [Letrouitia transgressa]|nr:MAG: hypothetical protein LQ351_001522 [Letrouitia transgressa]
MPIFVLSLSYAFLLFEELISASAISPKNTREKASVNLRIEGLSTTIYEGPIITTPRNITTPSGGTHLCDGANNGANAIPGITPTAALDAASKLLGFPYDGTYSDTFEDYFITSIADSTQTTTQFWGLLLNYQFTSVGGCQQEVQVGDHILWAFDAFSKAHFLKVTPSALAVRKGSSRTVTITDGMTGTAVAGALIGGVTTGADGKATLNFPKKGLFTYKATKSDSIRSNGLVVVVT